MIVPVTRPEYEKGEMVFTGTSEYEFVPVSSDEKTVAASVLTHKCQAVVLGVERYVGPLYHALPAGGIILRFGVGTDGIDRAQTQRRRIVVANTPGALDRSVAEHCMFLIGALTRHIAQGNQDLKHGKWIPRTGDELCELKLAVVGCGRVGAEVAQIAHLGFGMETLICELESEIDAASRLGISPAELRTRVGFSTWTHNLDDVLPDADIVTVHLPLTSSTEALFDASRFARFRDRSLFVNTARGGLVVEKDLAEALMSGKLAGAALDVYQNEPYQPLEDGIDLRQFPNVLMTPHIASDTRASNRRMASMVLRNLHHWARGEIDAVHVVF
jgi:D-3-phosphoglycerate dehydrogenase